MILLDYRTDNARWGLSGVVYKSWEGYAFSLGYLANINHYRNASPRGIVDLHIERNDEQGAWDKEGRIHYYGTDSYLKTTFSDWNQCKSKGVNNITYRINSNEYMYSLIYDYGFVMQTYENRKTADIFPPTADAFNSVWNILEEYLVSRKMSKSEISNIYTYFADGWSK